MSTPNAALSTRPLAMLSTLTGLACLLWAGHASGHGVYDWIAKGRYTGVDGLHCCGIQDCEEIDPTTLKLDKDGFLTPRGPIQNRGVHTTEDGKTWLCRNLSTGKPRCLFINRGG